MLPFGGQGSSQAIEDGGALGFLLKGVTEATEISERLKLFEKVREIRVSKVQIVSKARVGKEKDVESQVKQYTEGENNHKGKATKTPILAFFNDKKGVPTSFPERMAHDFGCVAQNRK